MTSPQEAHPMATRIDGEAPEIQVSLDILKRAIYVAPVVVGVCAIFAGLDGVFGALYGLALVLVNFLLAAALVSATARISLGLMMGAVLFGYLVRLGLIFLAVILVRDASWISLTALGLTIIVSHLGLLVWEMRFVAASLAYPGLKPRKS
jgi:hypothetical protein